MSPHNHLLARSIELEMFWNKSENKDNNQEPNTNEEARETRGIIPPENDGEVDNIINNVLSDFKGSEMRSKASDRVESLELNKFPVCIYTLKPSYTFG